MYNINLYTYWKKPFTSIGNYSIRPLDEEGNEKYYSNRSHVKHYLKKIDPFVFKSITGFDYNTLVKQQQNDIQILKNLKQTSFSSKKIEKIDDIIINNKGDINEEISIPKKNYIHEESKINTNHNSNIHNDSSNNEINISTIKPYNTQRVIRPYHKKRDFKDIYGYENKTSFMSNGEKYQYAINSMIKNKLNEDDFVKQKRKYDGFTPSETPLIKRNRPNSALFDYFNKRIKKTMKCLKKRKAMNEKELKKNLCNQTSKPFLKRYHLPDLIKNANTKVLIQRQKIGFSKEMGDKYNPYSFYIASKNRTRRNFFGDLFQN